MTQIINAVKARLEHVPGKTCRHCGKPLPSVHRSRRREDLLCFECFLATPRGVDTLLQGEDYQPPILGGSGYAGGRLVDQLHFHHSASEAGNAASFAYYHSVVLGWGEIAYNVVITNGNGGPDGQIQFGKPDDHYPFSVGNSLNYRALAVCLVGNFDGSKSPTAAQWSSLIDWMRGKARLYAIPREKILGHREARANSECPGFSGAMCEAVRREVASGPAPAPIPPKPKPKEDEVSIQHPEARLVGVNGNDEKWRVPWFDRKTAGLQEWLMLDYPSASAPGRAYVGEVQATIFGFNPKTGKLDKVMDIVKIQPGQTLPWRGEKLGDYMEPLEVDFNVAGRCSVALSNIAVNRVS